MQKVLFIIESLNCGGAEKSLVSLLSLLNPTICDLHVWVINKEGVFTKLLPEYVKQVDFELYDKDSFFDKLRFIKNRTLFSLSLRVNKLLSIKEHGAETLWKCMHSSFQKTQEYFDVVVAYQQGLPTYLLLSHFNAKKKIAWINADLFSVGYNKEFNKIFYDKIDTLVPVSDILKEKLCAFWPDLEQKMNVVYDVLSPDTIIKLSEETIRDAAKSDKTMLLTVGRLVPPKGYDLLLNAALTLKNKNISFIWYIIGEGSEKTWMESFIQSNKLEENVVLLGLKENPYPYMKLCDIYVQTSKYEGFGMTVGEAKILYKPIISTNFTVIGNQIKNEENGIIVDMKAEAIAEGVVRLIGDSDLRNKLVTALENEKNHTSITEVKKVEEFFL